MDVAHVSDQDVAAVHQAGLELDVAGLDPAQPLGLGEHVGAGRIFHRAVFECHVHQGEVDRELIGRALLARLREQELGVPVQVLVFGTQQGRVGGQLAHHPVGADELGDHRHDGVVVDDAGIGPEAVERQGDIEAARAAVRTRLVPRVHRPQQQGLEGMVPGVDHLERDQALQHGAAGLAHLLGVRLDLLLGETHVGPLWKIGTE